MQRCNLTLIYEPWYRKGTSMSLDSPPIPPPDFSDPSPSHHHTRKHTPVRFFHIALITGPLVLFLLLGMMRGGIVSTAPEEMATQFVAEPVPEDYPACGLPCRQPADCSVPLVCDQSPATWIRQGTYHALAADDVWKRQPPVDGARSWELAGITGGWYLPETNRLTVVSRNRYWVLDTTRETWESYGKYADLPTNHVWKQQPKIDGSYAWEEPDGITASWYLPDTQRLTVVSRNRYWVLHVPTNIWEDWGAFTDLPDTHIWTRQPEVEGAHAWDQAGITGGWYRPQNKILTVVSRNRYWNLDTQTNTWTTSGTFERLPEDHIWKQQPKVNGLYAWTGEGGTAWGITAAWVYPETHQLQIVSRDRYWVLQLEPQPVCKIPSCIGTACTCSQL